MNVGGVISATGVIYSGGDPCLTSYDAYTKTQTDSTFAPKANPTFTGTTTCSNLAVTGSVTGISKAAAQLGNGDTTTDASKPVSTAMLTALNGKNQCLTLSPLW